GRAAQGLRWSVLGPLMTCVLLVLVGIFRALLDSCLNRPYAMRAGRLVTWSEMSLCPLICKLSLELLALTLPALSALLILLRLWWGVVDPGSAPSSSAGVDWRTSSWLPQFAPLWTVLFLLAAMAGYFLIRYAGTGCKALWRAIHP